MLYNPKWEQKPDPYSLASLIAWLEQQPADCEYDWMDCCGECLIGQYMASIGIKWDTKGYLRFSSNSYVMVASEAPYTFGAALARARALT